MVVQKKNTPKSKSKKKVVRKRSTKNSTPKPWLKIIWSLFLALLLVGSMGAAFFVIFFSVPTVRASERPPISSETIMKPPVPINIDDVGHNSKMSQ